MEELTIKILKIIFYREDTSFAIIKAQNTETQEEIIIKGNMYKPGEGLTFLIKGFWKYDPKWGKQFNIQTAEAKVPKSIKGIESYLAHSKIPGLGPKLASRIAEYFKEELIEIIETDNIQRFREVPGIGKKKAESIIANWDEQKTLRNTMITLQEYGISPAISQKIFNKYKEQTIQKIQENPYLMIQDVYGIGFIKADEIAYNVGIKADNPQRVRAGIEYILDNAANNNGHLYLPYTVVIDKTNAVLERNEKYNVTISAIETELDKMIQTKALINENGNIFLKYLLAFLFH